MADKKISAMTPATSIGDSDAHPIVQSGANKKVPFSVLKDYLNYRKVSITIPGGATLRNLGSSPQTIIPAPAPGKYLNIIGVAVSYKFGTVAYDFSSAESLRFEIGAGNVCRVLDYSIINDTSSFNAILASYTGASPATLFISSSATALTLTTANGGDATVGDGDLDIVVYYSVEDVNT